MANKAISSLAVGSSVYLNVGGVRKEFLVVHQGLPSSMYDASCNGTWLLMKDIYENRAWDSSNANKYESSDIHSYLNSTFLNLFENNIRDAIKQVKIPYRKGGGSGGSDQSGANGLSAKIFLLSGYEVGWTTSDIRYLPVDGAKLDYFESGDGTSASNKRIATRNGVAVRWWLRSPQTNNLYSVIQVDSDGQSYSSNASNPYFVRPALVLPSDALVDDSGNVTPPVDLTAHKTLINGTAYTVQGGKCLVNGTGYDVKKGRTLINGTGYDIAFKSLLVMPVKGDLITMNLNGANRLYRVLKVVDETVVEVLTMWDLVESNVFSTLNDNVYDGSRLDKRLNTTWYDNLLSAAKAAIVPKNINQYKYSFSRKAYNETTHASYADYASKRLKTNVGNRYVYALDVEDIEMYFGGTGGSAGSITAGTFSTTDISQMFWNKRLTTSSKTIWLRSASGYSTDAWCVVGEAHALGTDSVEAYHAVRGAFQIDLSKIDFTTN